MGGWGLVLVRYMISTISIDISRYLNWVRVSRYHEVSLSNIHKYRDASIYRYIEYRTSTTSGGGGGHISRKKSYVILDWPLR